jgi:hypothetical protein
VKHVPNTEGVSQDCDWPSTCKPISFSQPQRCTVMIPTRLCYISMPVCPQPQFGIAL